MNLDDLFNTYASHLRARAARPNTVRSVLSRAAKLTEGLGGRVMLVEDLTLEQVNGFIQQRLMEVGASTVNADLRVLRAALGVAVAFGSLPQVPVRVQLLRAPRKLPTILEPAQLERLLRVAMDGPTGVALRLAAYAGLRQGEILHLHGEDVTPFRAVVVRAKGSWVPKDYEERAVPLTPSLSRYLAPHLHPGPLFAVTSLDRQVRDAFKRADLYRREWRPGLHMLRRTWASELLGRGADLETVRQLGGWESVVTMQRYLSTTEGRKRAAVELLEGDVL